jgi:uncharacterized protein (TIGR03437 family)
MPLYKTFFAALLLFLVPSGAVFAQVTYTIKGTLSLASGPDPLGLNGLNIDATAGLSQSLTPSSSETTSTLSTNTYGSVTVKLAGFPCSTASAPPVTVTLTDNAGAPDTIAINNCYVELATVNASVTIPDGSMITAVPASIPLTAVTGTVSYGGGSEPTSTFNLNSATIMATGTAPPTVTPSLTSWTPPTVPVGSTTPVSQQVTFTTTPPVGAVSFTNSTSASWLTVTPSATNTSSAITITANPTGLIQASNSGMVTLSYGSAYPATQIPVTLNLSGSLATLSAPASLSFTYAIGGSAPASQMLSVGASGSATVNAAVTSGNSWLSVSPASITAPGSFTVSVNTAGLPLGMLNGNIQLTATGATNSPLNVPVALDVTAATLTASPQQLNFTYQLGNSAQPAAQSIAVTDMSNVNFTAAAVTASGGSWLSVTPGTGSASGTLSVSVKTAELTANTYNGTVTIAVAGVNPNITPQVVNVSLVVSGSSVPTIGSVVSGASYASSGFSPGTIATIFGNLLGPATGVVFSLNSQGSLDSTLAGVSVTVGDAAAIPLYVLNGQVNIILPFTLGISGQAPVQVTYNNLTTAAFNIPLTTADVQIFTVNASGSGPGSILNQDNSVNSATNPAAPGSVVQVFGTGGGVLTGKATVTAGDVAGDTLAYTATCTATVNGETATVLYSGSAPDLVYGVDQFDIQLPADVTAGSAKIVLTIGGATSQSDVTVFVK